MQINGSIVLYKNEEELLKKAISSFLNTELEVNVETHELGHANA